MRSFAAHIRCFRIRSTIGALLWMVATTAAIGSDGGLDTTFAGRGFQYVSPVPSSQPQVWGLSVAVTNAGGYLLQGQQVDREMEGPTWNSLLQFRHDGSLDSAFGNGGRVLWLATESRTGFGVASDGRIFVGSTQNIRVFSGSGSPLTTIVPDPASASIQAMTVWKDRIVVLGWRSLTDSFEYRISRLLLDGQADPSFNGGETMGFGAGDVDPPWLYLHQLAVRDDGAIALFGSIRTPDNNRVTVVVIHPDGTPDTAFNANSAANIHFDTCTNAPENATAGAWQRDGKLLVLAYIIEWPCGDGDPESATHGGIARLAADGTLDASYGNAGHVLLEPGGSIPSRSNAQAIQLQQDQRAIIVGNRHETDGMPRATMTRLNANGSVDTDFGTPGLPDSVPGVASYDYAQYAFETPGYTEFSGLVLDANRPVAVGALTDHYLITRMENDAIMRDGF
ncbi:MAG: hypothetical protein ABI411_09070 [Tahibacter sp.]